MQQEGIIVGCDQTQEWLLPWWWKHYSANNSYPVLFVDFGMSQAASQWCKQQGLYTPLRNFELFQEKEVPFQKKQLWETYISSLFTFRTAFFKKPFALSQTPFTFSIWLDLDCQVKQSLEPLFFPLNLGIEISIRKNKRNLQALDSLYNSGVIAFRRDAKFLSLWVGEVLERNDQHLTDEHALSLILTQESIPLIELPEIYNWNPLYGDNPEAAILHFQGGFLKQEIRRLN